MQILVAQWLSVGGGGEIFCNELFTGLSEPAGLELREIFTTLDKYQVLDLMCNKV